MQGNSPVPEQDCKAAGTLASHAQDVADVVGALGRTPVMVGHSFGGLILQAYLAQAAQQAESDAADFPLPPGNVFLCSSPPDKIDVMRYMRNAPLLSVKVCVSMSNFGQARRGLLQCVGNA